MAGLYKKYSEQGLHIVGLHCQNSSPEEIKTACKSAGVEFQITTGGDIKGANVSGIPHGFLFDATGKMVAEDPRGNELEKKIKELIKETGAAMAGAGPYVKLAPLAAQIKSGQALGTVLKTLASKKTSKDADEAKEAAMMYDALSGAANDQLSSALAAKDENPAGAVAKLEKLATQFSGDEIATKAKAEAETLKKDPKVKKELEADTMLKQINTMVDGLKPVRGQKDPSDASFRKVNQTMIAGIVGGCQALAQRYPGTVAAKKAEELMNDYK